MKLVRFDESGHEAPGLIDNAGLLRDHQVMSATLMAGHWLQLHWTRCGQSILQACLWLKDLKVGAVHRLRWQICLYIELP